MPYMITNVTYVDASFNYNTDNQQLQNISLTSFTEFQTYCFNSIVLMQFCILVHEKYQLLVSKEIKNIIGMN